MHPALSLTKKNKILVLIILASIFFRFYRFTDFQYWSDDEQLFWYVVRHVVIDKHLSLTQPNTAIGAGLGTIWHLIVSVWAMAVSMNPSRMLILGNILGVVNALLFYFAGKTVANKKVGLIASGLYATSFMAAIFDRRLWALTPNISLMLLAIMVLTKTIQDQKKYFWLMAIPFGFSLNSDPTLGVICLTTIICLGIFKLKISKNQLAKFIIVFLALTSPLIIFDIRHSGQNIRSIIQFASSQVGIANVERTRSENLFLGQVKNFSRFLLPTPTNFSDSYFCYCFLDDKPTWQMIVAGMIIAGFGYLSFKEKKKECQLLLLFIALYIVGIWGFREILEGNPAFFYTITIAPIIYLMTAIVISRNKFLLALFLSIYIFINTNALLTSNFKYPLSEKLKIAQTALGKIPQDTSYSLYYSGDIMMANGGWTALFDYTENRSPIKGSLSLYWRHPYEVYGLYTNNFSNEDGEKIIVLSENKNNSNISKYPEYTEIIGNTNLLIYDNKTEWFNPDINIEKLYQPKYF